MLFVMYREDGGAYLRVHEPTGEWEVTVQLNEATVFRMNWIFGSGMAIVPKVPDNTPATFHPRPCQYHLVV